MALGKAFTVSASGLRELDAALADLGKAAARGVMTRTLVKAAEPVAVAARGHAEANVRTGELKGSIAVGAKITNEVGKAEFSNVLRGGGSKAQAVSAMRDARRSANGEGTVAVAFIGYKPPTGSAKEKKARNIKRYANEWGNRRMAPQPNLRPAWDEKQGVVLAGIKTILGDEIKKSVARSAKRKAAKAAKAVASA